ncbi:hypothetical protein G6F35_016640 [Rhizopus arrhizus]|nr:hypothetical protein G6F35_016640 [Rhizopus arrhizus]
MRPDAAGLRDASDPGTAPCDRRPAPDARRPQRLAAGPADAGRRRWRHGFPGAPGIAPARPARAPAGTEAGARTVAAGAIAACGKGKRAAGGCATGRRGGVQACTIGLAGAYVSAGGGMACAENAKDRAICTAGRRRAVIRLVSAGPTKITPSPRVKRRSTCTARSCVAASK